jgi:hypothetical protein
LDVQAINPRNGEKYSLNLYQWLTKRDDKMRAWASRVYREADGSLFVGWPSESYPGEFIGARMGDILCYGRKSECFCWLSLVLEEIPGFWTPYNKNNDRYQDTFSGTNTEVYQLLGYQ